MNVSKYALPHNNTLMSSFAELANVSVSSTLSNIILGTSLVGIVGLLTHRFSHQKPITPGGPTSTFDDSRTKVQKAYTYVFGGFALTTLTAAVAHVSGFSLQFLKHPFLIGIPLFAASMYSIVKVATSDKSEGTKQKIKWVVFNTLMGASLSVVGFYDKKILAQAATISLGIGGIATLTSYLAPDETFLKWEGPLLNGLMGLSLLSLGCRFFPTQAINYGINRFITYAGLAAYTGLLMSSTHRLYKEAKEQTHAQFDAIKSSLSIYLDGVNIFVKVLEILNKNEQENQKKKKAGKA